MKEKNDLKTKCPRGSFPYTIRSGDTLYLLARKYNTTVEAIMRINPGINPNNLQIGQVICIPEATGQKPPCPNGFYYTIKSGDTFYTLSKKFGVSVEALMRANPGVDPNNLQIGQVICVPQMAPPKPPCPNGFYYTIKPGDTFYSLSQEFGVSVEALMRANPGVDPNNLQIDQVICVPQMAPPKPPCPNGFYYTIKPGDTFYSLSQEFGVSVEALMRANPGVDPNNLQIGQVICVPQSMPPTPPMPPCPNGFYYTVKPGDTLYSIGQHFNIGVQEIMRANPGVDPNNLQIGQILCMPRKFVVFGF